MPHLFVHVLLMLQKFCIFFRTFAQAPRLFFFGYSDTPWTCITFGILISDISDIQHLIYLCMLWKFRIFLGHLPEHQRCFFWIFLTLLGHLLHLKYLCQVFQTFSTSFLCAHSADAPEVPHFFQDIYSTITVVFL